MLLTQGRAVAARNRHKVEVGSSNLSPATRGVKWQS